MKVLVACEESQVVCKAFREKGHEAYSCDIIECSGGHPEWHIMQDVLPLLNGNCDFKTTDGMQHFIEGKWDMIIAFPPCTHLAVSGARHFEQKRADGRQKEGIEFFCQFLNADCEKIAIENPVGIISGDYIPKWFPELAEKYNLPLKQSQIIQPYEYGHNAKKSTCLWLKGLPLLKPTKIVEPDLISYTCKSGKKVTFSRHMVQGFENGERAKSRSKTFEGVGNAMAEQWGNENINKGEEKEMELKLKEITFPEVIEFNFDELKAEIKERTEKYVDLVYTDDQIKDAKKDVATLRKFTKALSDERIKVKKDILKPYDEFEGKIKELTAIVDTAITGIDKQVKEYEDKKREDKMDEIFLIWNKKEVPEWLHISKVFDEKWLNASVTLKKVEEEIDARLEQIQRDLATLANLSEFSFEAIEVYKDTVDINKAIQEGIRLSEIQKRKAEQAQSQAIEAIHDSVNFQTAAKLPEDILQPKQEVCFRCWLSTEDAAALREFFQKRNIKYGAI